MPADTNGDGDTRREAWRRALAPDLGPRPGVGHSAGSIVRTAISFEPRDGHLFVFMPPTERTEDYLDLVTAVEDTAEELGQPVFIEGYPPPGSDPRLLSFSVTPDPGVIEVNIHPSTNWRELVDKTEIVYEEARTTRLGAAEIHDRRPPHRHRRRQPCHPGRTVGRRLAAAAPARPAEEPVGLLAQPSVAVLPVLRPVHRPDQPASARRRGAQRRPARARDRLPPDQVRPSRRRPGWSTASSATSWSTPPATPIAPSSASTSCSRPTPPRAGAACWNCAPSRCRRTGA